MSYNYDRVATPSGGLRLFLNENTAGCSPAVLEAVQAVTRQQVACYPDYDIATAACAARLGVPADRVQLTNGLDEGILLLSMVALRGSSPDSPLETVICVPAFDMYGIYAEAAAGRVVEVAAGPDLEVPVDRVIRAINERTRLIWLTSPNNPSGLVTPREEVLRIASAARGALVVVDEAYADFAGESMLDENYFDRLPNLVVGRTFAKAYGMAGLRAGALIGTPETLAPIRRIVPPYSLNVCAAAALPAACADTEYYAWYLEEVRASKALLYGALDRLSIPYFQSAANFVLARFDGRAARVVRGLGERHVFVRDRSTDPACPGCVRITAGIVEHTRICISALEGVLCGEV